ncbi:MAG: hypothetical protein ACREIV_04360 [Planctomycetaceae bacterium]
MKRQAELVQDTTPEAARIHRDVLRRLGPARRLEMGVQLSQTMRLLIEAGVRHRHPELSEPQVRREVLRLMIGETLSHKCPRAGKRGPVIDQTSFLLEIIHKLDAAGVPYMVTGSFGCNLHGQPRATNDVDIVILPTAGQLESLLDSLEEHYYADRETARTALARCGMFNVIDTEGGWKADLIIRKPRPFSVTEFDRRSPVPFGGTTINAVTAEDAILSKLEWAKKADSERQVRDAVSIADLQRDRLDDQYLRKWARELRVARKLDEVLRQDADDAS